ncbi:MAG: ArsR family transcriptional regulator [Peptococcaceae bacterium BRH_c4b]|nr:MAG: ArsR family transcriptional regulator [Peptococcaceae bacterium BRH_c4b]
MDGSDCKCLELKDIRAAIKEEDVCEIFCSDQAKVERIRKLIHATEGLASMFKSLADDTRIKIVYALSLDELCVCDVANITGSSVATASHHLRLLRNSGLAKYRKEGKLVYYSLQDNCIREIINAAIRHSGGSHGKTDCRE